MDSHDALTNCDLAEKALHQAGDWVWNLVYQMQDHRPELEPSAVIIVDDIKAALNGLNKLRRQLGLPTNEDIECRAAQA